MKLFIVHCGFADKSVSNGVYESHTNFFVVAEDFAGAKAAARALPEYKRLGMHIDSLQEIEAVEGYELSLKKNKKLDGQTRIHYKNPWSRT